MDGPGLARRLLAEFLGTAALVTVVLVTVVVGSGIAAAALSPNDVGLQLLENSTATVFGVVLILVFGPVSGAHFNPVVTGADWLLGRPSGAGVSGRDAVAYTAVRVSGAVAGAWLVYVMFDRRVVSGEFPKPWTDEIVQAADVVIAMGCADACPIYPGKRYENWELPTPPAYPSTPSDRSATASKYESAACWPTSTCPSMTSQTAPPIRSITCSARESLPRRPRHGSNRQLPRTPNDLRRSLWSCH